jgi:hypothetical protein
MRGIHIERGILLILLLLALGVTAKARAESAVFVDGVLHVPEVLVTDTLEPHMVVNAELHLNASGLLDVVGSSTTPMSRLQSISTTAEVTRGDIAIVHINVLKTWQCAKSNPVKVVQQGKAFYIAVTEQPVPENARCLPGNYQFLTHAAIDTSPLQPGEYQVYAHGRHIAFTVLAP